jgi:hypothetical protein
LKSGRSRPSDQGAGRRGAKNPMRASKALKMLRFAEDGVEVGLDRGRGNGIAGDQAAAADGNDQGVEIGDVVEHFERDRPLPGHHTRVVIRGHDGKSTLTPISPLRLENQL